MARSEYMPTSIVVLTREHIGDLVCTTPALRSLRRLYPQAHIAVEVGERAVTVLKNNPNVDEIVPRADHQGIKGKLSFLLYLRRRKFDMAVLLDDSTHMPLTVWLGGARIRVGLVRKRRFARLLTIQVPVDLAVHEMVDNFRNVVAALGADISDPSPEVFPSNEDRVHAAALLRETGIEDKDTIVALNPGASAPSNRWLPEYFSELAVLLSNRLNCRILLLGGKEDLTAAKAILDGARAGIPVDVLTGKLNIQELAVVLERCSLLISGDTGPMHLSCAVRTPVLALFGPAVPSESGPGYMPGNRVIRKVEGCSGCTKYVCNDDKSCMRLITPEEVAEAAVEMLAKGKVEG